MRGFTFRLDRVLRLRAGTEKQRARDLGMALREEAERRAELESAAERLERLAEQVTGDHQTPEAAGTMRNLRLAIEANAEALDAATASHQAAVESVVIEQARWSAARRDREVLERLRERRADDWKQEDTRREQSHDDEVERSRRQGGGDTW